eukprot:jgi/Galph1/5365/GphlegSOOS_G4038.1
MPYSVSESEEKSARERRSTPGIGSFSETNAMQVDYGEERKRVVRDEPQGSSVSLKTTVQPGMVRMLCKPKIFDWNAFLRSCVFLSEEEARRYASMFSRIFGDDPGRIQRETLQMLRIPEANIQKVLAAVVLLQGDLVTFSFLCYVAF